MDAFQLSRLQNPRYFNIFIPGTFLGIAYILDLFYYNPNQILKKLYSANVYSQTNL